MNMKLLAAAVIALNISACATVTKGSNDTVKIASTPSDAKIVFEDTANKLQDQTCMTPCEIELKRKNTYETTVSKKGYSTFVTTLVPKVSTSGGAGMAGNVLFGGIIGAGVDAATGAMKDLSPNNFNVMLQAEGTPSYAEDKDGKKILSQDEADKMMEEAEKAKEMEEAAKDKVSAVSTSDNAG